MQVRVKLALLERMAGDTWSWTCSQPENGTLRVLLSCHVVVTVCEPGPPNETDV